MNSGSGGSKSKPDEQILQFDGYHHQNHHYHESSHHCRRCIFNVLIKIALVFVTVAVVWLGLNQSLTYSAPCLERSSSFLGPKGGSIPYSAGSSMQENVSSLSEEAKANGETLLETTLKNASMGKTKTVILTTLNAAWTKPNSLFDLFLKSFKIGNQTERLLNHLVVIVFDQKAYSRCLEVHKHCYPLTTEQIDFSNEAHYMSKDYLKMMWRRTDFLRTVLELGYSFVFTDADILWLRDPFPRFHPEADFQIACDRYNHNSTDMNNFPNGGFKYVRANNRTVRFYKFWNMGKNFFHGKNEQDVLNIIKFYPYIQEIGLKIRFLDTAYFGGFCEPSKDLDLVITMHANCCIGMKNKIHDIKMLIADWTKYMALPSGERNLSSKSWTVPRICG